LTWSPKTSLEEGLMACVRWFKGNRDLACRIGLGG
jgi:hypothetical protein